MEKAAILVLRLAGLFTVLMSVWLLAAHGVQAWGKVDAVYWDLFLRSRLLPPAIGVAVGVILWAGSKRLAKFLTRDLS